MLWAGAIFGIGLEPETNHTGRGAFFTAVPQSRPEARGFIKLAIAQDFGARGHPLVGAGVALEVAECHHEGEAGAFFGAELGEGLAAVGCFDPDEERHREQ